MSNNDFFYEEEHKSKKLILFFLLLVLIGVGLYFYYNKSKYILNVRNITYELGDELSFDLSKYVSSKINEEEDYSLILDNVINENGKLLKVGEYTYKVKYKKISKNGIIKVVDTSSPTYKLENITVGLNSTFKADDFVESCEDYSKPCIVELVDENDYNKTNKVGEYKIKISISDSVGNKVVEEVKLTVKNGEEIINSKVNDLNYSYTDPKLDDFDGTMVIKFDKAIEPSEIYMNENLEKLLNLLESDLHEYLSDEYKDNGITKTDSLYVYNKYGYIIGFAVRITLDNNKSFYIK